MTCPTFIAARDRMIKEGARVARRRRDEDRAPTESVMSSSEGFSGALVEIEQADQRTIIFHRV